MINFGHQNLRVSDLEKSIHFYETQLDMKLRKRIPKEKFGPMAWLDYGDGGFFLELAQSAVVRGNNHIAFVTDQRDALYRRHNAARLVDYEIPELGIYFMHDPDGNSIEIMPLTAMDALSCE